MGIWLQGTGPAASKQADGPTDKKRRGAGRGSSEGEVRGKRGAGAAGGFARAFQECASCATTR